MSGFVTVYYLGYVWVWDSNQPTNGPHSVSGNKNSNIFFSERPKVKTVGDIVFILIEYILIKISVSCRES